MHTNIKPLFTSIQFTPKSYDIDFSGVMHNSVYILWLEDLRMKMLQNMISLGELQSKNLAVALVNTTINYRLPIKFGDEISGELWVNDVTKSSWELKAEFKNSTGTCYSDAMQTGVFVSQRNGKWRATAMPNEVMEKYRQQAE